MSSSAWALCFVSIRFDLDVGPVVECVAPPGALSDEGKKLLTQVAFPDCNPESGHDFIFFFLMKDCTAAQQSQGARHIGASCAGRSARNIYGATYYRQKRDASVPRGYVQQAVVLLSQLPYMAVHELILRVVVPRFCQCCLLSPDTEKVPVLSAVSPVPSTFFELDSSFNPSQYSQEEVLQRAVEEIEGWPSLHPHVQYNLMLLCQPLTFVTPTRCLQSFCGQTAIRRCVIRLDNRVEFLSSERQSFGVHDVIPLYAVLSEHLRYVTRMWELLLCHEPLFIWSNTPSMASATAFAVASLVRPIEFNGVLHAYFTVQNELFGRFSRMGNAIPFPKAESIIVGATNPFFFRAFEGWQNRLTVVNRQADSARNLKYMNGCCSDNGNCSPIIVSPRAASAAASSCVSSPCDGPPSPSGGVGHPGIPRIFTYSNFFPALIAARQGTTMRHDSPSVSAGVDASLPHQQAASTFTSSFHFLADHKQLTAILLHRLEQASHLNGEAQLASLNAHVWNGCKKLEGGGGGGGGINNVEVTNDRAHVSCGSQPFSQYSVADDVLRKFFVSLTKEFLMPVSAWFQSRTSTLTLFHLCDTATLTVFAPESFLHFLEENREAVPSFLSHQPYKVYSSMYERFAKGSLFRSVLWQLVDAKVRQALKEIEIDNWAAQHPSEVERIEMFVNLYKLVSAELEHSMDPDFVFVTMATSVLGGMATHISEPLREQLLSRIRVS